jgi:DNA adenine methylase
VERAARMIFLNKTCFNGLWRVNARGEYNVPIGSQTNPNLYDEENILAASRALQGVHLAEQDFRDTLSQTRRGDFAYIVSGRKLPVLETGSSVGEVRTVAAG